MRTFSGFAPLIPVYIKYFRMLSSGFCVLFSGKPKDMARVSVSRPIHLRAFGVEKAGTPLGPARRIEFDKLEFVEHVTIGNVGAIIVNVLYDCHRQPLSFRFAARRTAPVQKGVTYSHRISANSQHGTARALTERPYIFYRTQQKKSDSIRRAKEATSRECPKDVICRTQYVTNWVRALPADNFKKLPQNSCTGRWGVV